jgi:hypothetical protein
MKHVLALIAVIALIANTSIAFAGCPSGPANPPNVCWSQEQAAGCVGSIWGDFSSCKSSDDAQKDLDACWFKHCGSLTGVPSCGGKKVGDLCQDKCFLEILLCILFELHQCPTHSGCA